MTKKDLVRYLRLSVDVVEPDSREKDSLYLKLSDDDLLLYIDMARTRAYSDESLDDFPESCIYPLMLLAKKELYLALAIRHARFVDLKADDYNEMKKSQWFNHYITLADEMENSYANYLDQGGNGSGTMYSASTYLSSRYYTNYNHEKELPPSLKLRVDKVTEDTIEVSWDWDADSLLCFKVFLSTVPVVEYHDLGQAQIDEISREIAVIRDPHLCKCRIRGCASGTDYYVVVTVTDWAWVTVYKEIKVTTLISDETLKEEVFDVCICDCPADTSNKPDEGDGTG